MAGKYGRRRSALGRRRRIVGVRRGLYRHRRVARMRGRSVVRAAARRGEPWHWIDGSISAREIPRNGFGTLHPLIGDATGTIQIGMGVHTRLGQWVKPTKVHIQYELMKNAAIDEDRIRVLVFYMKDGSRAGTGADLINPVWNTVRMGSPPQYFGFVEPGRVQVLYDKCHRLFAAGASNSPDRTLLSTLRRITIRRLRACRWDGELEATETVAGRGQLYIGFFSNYTGENYSKFNLAWRTYFKP